jgi:hypothetical protein
MMRCLTSLLRHPWLGAFCLACSGQPGTIDSGGAPLGGAERPESIDPTRPGATLLCHSEEHGASLWVVSAMNHKLRTYPDFARAIGVDLVSDCEGANRFFAGYAAYSEQHVDFDADEPEPPRSEIEPAPPSTSPPPAEDVPKIAGGEESIVNHPVVQIQFTNCATVGCPRADDSWIVKRPGEPDVDWRKKTSKCTATFIAKNWLLTSAHCITAVAIDSCMEHGDTFSECVPTWDTWGLWTITGTRPNQAGRFNPLLWARAYVYGSWFGRPLSQNPVVCTAPNCSNLNLAANDDLALLYVPTAFDDALIPNIEPDGAKRLSATSPEAAWNLAFYGWGQPHPLAGDILRRGRNFFDTFTVRERRIDIAATSPRPFPCAGDSGGPMVRAGVELDTNLGVKQGLEVIVGVTSWAGPPCPRNVTSAPAQSGNWATTRVDHPEHMKFIVDTMRRYPEWRNFECKARGLVGLEAVECWGAPCSNDSGPELGGCALPTQMCVNSGRQIASKQKKFSCQNCEGTPQQGSCECIVGQCLSK